MVKRNILVIDDNPDDVELVSRTLTPCEQCNYHIDGAHSGESGLSMASSHYYDCILLDYSIPGVSGFELLNQLVEQFSFIPVILMTGQGNEELAVNAIKRGAENYLVKSHLSSELLDKTISDAVNKKQLEEALATKDQELAQQRVELNDTLDFLSLVQTAMPGYIFVKDSNFKIIRANQQFMALYPADMQDKIIGYTTFEQYDPEEKDAFLAMDKKAFKDGCSETLEKITFPNGEIRSLNTVKTRFYNAKGEAFILCTATDVTERESLIAQLEASNKDLEQFAYVASHDLKSPLNAIKKLVSWIEEDYIDDIPRGAKTHFDMIKKRCERLSQLLTDILEYSRIDKKLGAYETVDFLSLIQLTHTMIDGAEHYKISVEDCKISLPKTALQIVFLNLINNSIKHHNKSHGNIVITVKELDSGYLIYHEDDGPGIEQNYAEKVFEMFQTLKTRDQVEGSGMGLAMVKKILEHYRGSIRLVYENKSLQGAKFEIFWPKDRTRS